MTKATMRQDELKFASVREVDGVEISVKAEKLHSKFNEKKYYCEIGAYVNCGGEHGDTLCLISRVQVVEIEKTKKIDGEIHYITEEINKVILSVVGTVSKGRFDRGAARLPTIGCNVYFLSDDQVNSIIGVESEADKEFFLVTNPEVNKTYLNLDKLIGRHTAILGTTGSGKSSTVASIVQSILNSYKCPRIVFFDMHNEYPDAFGFGEEHNDHFRSKTNCIAWSDFSLPYWFLDLEEFIGVFYPSAGSSQESTIKDIIKDLKREESGLTGGDCERISANTPLFFDINKLVKKLKELEDAESTATKKDPFAKLRLRFESVLDDSRYGFLKKDIDKKTSLSNYLKHILGMFESEKYLSILDLSGLPSEVRNVCIGVLSRLLFDFKYWEKDPDDLPLALILEEAHSYIPEETEARFSLCKERVERIAKEGRKYGIGLIVITQRPSNVSTTVLSQCGTFITLRLTNDGDQNKVKRLLPDTLAGQADALSGLRDGEALVSGDGIKLPRKVQFKRPDPAPRSNDVKYHIAWESGPAEGYSLENATKAWEQLKK